MKTPEEIARFERIEEAARYIAMEIREAQKIGQYTGQEWIRQKLEDVLKPVKK